MVGGRWRRVSQSERIVGTRMREEDSLTICTEQEMSGILPSAPLDLVDLFLDLKRFEVIELGLVGLKLGVELVFAALFLCVSVKFKETEDGQHAETFLGRERSGG